MVHVSPIGSYLVKPDMAAEVAALPYDVFTMPEAVDEIARYPKSFLRIDKTAALLPDKDEHDKAVYIRAREIMNTDIQSSLYQLDNEKRFYLYRMVWEESGKIDSDHAEGKQCTDDGQSTDSVVSTSHVQLGLVASVDAVDYRNNTVLRHENTRPEKLQDRIEHIVALNAQASPVLMTHRFDSDIADLLVYLADNNSVFIDFVAPDNVRHTLWTVDSSENSTIEQAYQRLEHLYIADGHHRAEAAVQVGDQGILSILFPADELRIFGYNRIVKDLNGLSKAEFLHRLSEFYSIGQQVPANSFNLVEPQMRGQLALYLDNEWYRLAMNESIRPAEVLAALDVSVLQEMVLDPLLGIDDPRTSPRITYVGGSLGLDSLMQQARLFGDRPEQALAFALAAVEFDDFFAVADSGQLMPPKSTWFAPKPRSGLFIRPLE